MDLHQIELESVICPKPCLHQIEVESVICPKPCLLNKEIVLPPLLLIM